MFIYIFSIARERYFGGTVFRFVLSTMRLEFFKNLLRISRRSFCLRPLL